ncbi:LysR family transcriptional regulator [Roseomonas sp. GCM10028921]
MDIELARTFLAIVATGSFVRAAERLHLSQTTVSARVRALEEQLRRQVFVRSKAGASLTPAGEQFLRHAPALVQLWERARHQVAVPAGRRTVLAIGGEFSLWDMLLLPWLVWMRSSAADVALRVLVGLPEDLMDQVGQGVLDVALVYEPRYRPGLKVELVAEEKLVMVSTPPRFGCGRADYVEVDWGPSFARQHGSGLPVKAEPGLFVSLGPLGLGYILEVGGSGYFRLGAVQSHLESGRLVLVKDAPEFFYPTHAVYAEESDADLIQTAITGLRHVALPRAEASHLHPSHPVRWPP